VKNPPLSEGTRDVSIFPPPLATKGILRGIIVVKVIPVAFYIKKKIGLKIKSLLITQQPK
jgi:hypothetical protein